jgi:hypothetical protein
MISGQLRHRAEAAVRMREEQKLMIREDGSLITDH